MTHPLTFYGLAVQKGCTSAMTFNLFPKTEADIRNMAKWQKEGGFSSSCSDGYHVCQHDPERGVFVCIDCKAEMVPSRLPYTEVVWREFCERMGLINEDVGPWMGSSGLQPPKDIAK